MPAPLADRPRERVRRSLARRREHCAELLDAEDLAALDRLHDGHRPAAG